MGSWVNQKNHKQQAGDVTDKVNFFKVIKSDRYTERQRARQNCTDKLQRLMMKKLKLFIQKLTRGLEIRKKNFLI